MEVTEEMLRVIEIQRLLTFQRWRAQAKMRGETVSVDYAQWCGIWGDQWYQRGRAIDSLCLTRRDWSKPWTVDNCEIVTRREHFNTRSFKKRQREGDPSVLGRKAIDPMEKF